MPTSGVSARNAAEATEAGVGPALAVPLAAADTARRVEYRPDRTGCYGP
jgi:hypothetical protein